VAGGADNGRVDKPDATMTRHAALIAGSPAPAGANEPHSVAPAQGAEEAAVAVVHPVAAAAQLSAPATAPQLARALETWRVRLTSAGVACRAVALHSADVAWQQPFDAAQAALQARWQALRATLAPGQAVAVDRPAGGAAGHDLLLACPITLPDGAAAQVGLALAPPYSDRTVQLVLLSLGWLQLALAEDTQADGRRARQLTALLAEVATQPDAHLAAQAWLAGTAAWVRRSAPAGGLLVLSLWAWRGHQARLWAMARCGAAGPSSACDAVTARTGAAATAEATTKGAPAAGVSADLPAAAVDATHAAAAAECATRAAVEQAAVHAGPLQAWPVLQHGQVVAVLVAQHLAEPASAAGGRSAPALPIDAAAQAALHDSLALAMPLLLRWQAAERPLWRHGRDAVAQGAQRLVGPGHWRWKLGMAAVPLAVLAALAWPVPERVAAPTVIEGRLRQLVTAPFDGFFGQVLVRPGAQVQRGQVLARLDTRDLLLEQARQRSALDQAAGKLRQAMAERDASAMALAAAEQQQAQALLSLAEAKLARAELVAPLDGLLVTGDWAQQVGAPVENGKELFEVAAGQGWRVVLHVPERDIAKVRVGQTGELRLSGQPDQAHAFRISTVTATASVQDGGNGFRVEAEWLGPAPALSPGMQGVGKIEVGTSPLLAQWTRAPRDWLRLKLWSWWW
jgi:multidrug efflux pump subunit AcrA (membrane-fusion protein)